MTARDRVLDALTAAGCKVSNVGSSSTCPAHEDHAPSVSIGNRRDGDGVLIKCHAGCSTTDVLAALGMTDADLFDEAREKSTKAQVVARYDYTDEAGVLLYQKVRFEPKTFRQRRPEGNGWSWSLADARRVLYRLPEVLAAIAADAPVFVCEGEKDADALRAAGMTATTWTEGAWKPDQAPKWRADYTEALRDARVAVVGDRDDPGRHTAATIAASLADVAASVVVLEPVVGKDVSDHLAAGRTVAELVVVPESAPVAPVEPLAPVSPEGPKETGAVLDDVRSWLSRFIATMTPADLDLLTLWAAHTWLAVETYTTPRLVLDSPVPGSGKTTTLEHLHRLCIAPVQAASLSSPALLARMLNSGIRTILIDEADRSLDPKKEGVGELLAILNSGYKRGGTRPVLVPGKEGKWDVAEMPTFSPVVMAGNNPQLPEDTRQRCIRVLLLPDLTGRIEESDWELIDDDAQALGARLRRWADQVRDDVRTARPPLPEGITGRFRECWAPLKRVAVTAGGTWPQRVDEMALHDKEQTDMDREDGMIREKPALLLLRHLHDLWPEGEPFMPTTTLVELLAVEHPDEWGDGSPFGKPITAHRLGRMLATSYKVNSRRMDRDGARGYVRASLLGAWQAMGIEAAPAPAPVPTPPPKQTGASGANGETGTPLCSVCRDEDYPLTRLDDQTIGRHPSCPPPEAVAS